MFSFSKDQEVYDIAGQKVGGQPGEFGFIGMMVSIVGWRGVLVFAILFFGFGALTMGPNIAWSEISKD